MFGLERWEGRAVHEWQEAWGLPRLQIHDSIGSTNDAARALAETGAPAGTTVLADHQSLGRGQRGRSWHAAAGKGILVSVVLRPGVAGERAPGAVAIRVGLAVARAIESVTGLSPGLKWPNDLTLGRAKLGGILCEGSLAGSTFVVVAGVGINVLQGAGDFPPGLDPPATSLALALGPARTPPPRPRLAGAVATAVAALGADAARPLSPAELREYDARDILRGWTVTLDGTTTGIASGIAPDGALLVLGPGGPAPIHGGTVRATAPPAGATRPASRQPGAAP